MVSKISQGGYGTVYRGVLEPWLARIFREKPLAGPHKKGRQVRCSAPIQWLRNRRLIGLEALSRQNCLVEVKSLDLLRFRHVLAKAMAFCGDMAWVMSQARRTHLVAVKDMKGDRRVQLYELLKEACVRCPRRIPSSFENNVNLSTRQVWRFDEPWCHCASGNGVFEPPQYLHFCGRLHRQCPTVTKMH